MSHIRWIGVILGSVATVVLALALLAFVSLVLEPFVSSLTGTVPVDGVTSTTVAEERIRGLLMGVSVISALLLAFLVGGLVVGRFATSHAGLNGAVMGVVILAIPFVWLLGSIVIVLLNPAGSPGEVITRSESLRMLVAAFVVYSVFFPIIVLAGFLGGRVGRRLLGT
jgi:uncharacterized membrane protein